MGRSRKTPRLPKAKNSGQSSLLRQDETRANARTQPGQFLSEEPPSSPSPVPPRSGGMGESGRRKGQGTPVEKQAKERREEFPDEECPSALQIMGKVNDPYSPRATSIDGTQQDYLSLENQLFPTISLQSTALHTAGMKSRRSTKGHHWREKYSSTNALPEGYPIESFSLGFQFIDILSDPRRTKSGAPGKLSIDGMEVQHAIKQPEEFPSEVSSPTTDAEISLGQFRNRTLHPSSSEGQEDRCYCDPRDDQAPPSEPTTPGAFHMYPSGIGTLPDRVEMLFESRSISTTTSTETSGSSAQFQATEADLRHVDVVRVLGEEDVDQPASERLPVENPRPCRRIWIRIDIVVLVAALTLIAIGVTLFLQSPSSSPSATDSSPRYPATNPFSSAVPTVLLPAHSSFSRTPTQSPSLSAAPTGVPVILLGRK